MSFLFSEYKRCKNSSVCLKQQISFANGDGEFSARLLRGLLSCSWLKHFLHTFSIRPKWKCISDTDWMKLVIQQLQNKVEMSWIVANSQQFTSCKFSQYICRGKAEDIYFTQIGSFLTSSPNLSGLQMRRCEFIFSGKWDFDRKFTERLPATAGCLILNRLYYYTVW